MSDSKATLKILSFFCLSDQWNQPYLQISKSVTDHTHKMRHILGELIVIIVIIPNVCSMCSTHCLLNYDNQVVLAAVLIKELFYDECSIIIPGCEEYVKYY